MSYEVHPDAQEEFIEAATYYESEVPGLGERFGGEVRRAIGQILKFPEIGTPIDRHLRRFTLTRFPYSLIYGFSGDLVRVVAVAHVRRRPGYWKSRVTRRG